MAFRLTRRFSRRELVLDVTLAGRLVRKRGPSTRDIIDRLQSGEDVEARLQDAAEAAARAFLRSPERLRGVLSDRSAPSLFITGSAVVFLRPSQDDGRQWLRLGLVLRNRLSPWNTWRVL